MQVSLGDLPHGSIGYQSIFAAGLVLKEMPFLFFAGLTALSQLDAPRMLGIGASLGGPTGYAINPARDLGPRIMHALLPIRGKGPSDWSYSWVPVLGPLVGSIIAAVLFSFLAK